MSLLTFLMITAFVLGMLSGFRDNPEERDPIEVARPSIERMEAEALEAAKELRQLEPPGKE
jgi:hypothetical protein